MASSEHQGKTLVSLKDVAAIAGVSVATASRALDPESTHPVSDRTRREVMAVANRLGYERNLVARAWRTKKQPSIAVIVHDLSDPYFAQIVRGVDIAARRVSLLTIVCDTHRDPVEELDYLRLLHSLRIGTVIFAGAGFQDVEYISEVQRITSRMRDFGAAIIALQLRPENWPTELPDNEGGARLAVRHLLEEGHRNIACIKGPSRLTSSVERESGYLTEMLEWGLSPTVLEADLSADGGAAAAKKLVDSKTPLDAIFATTDQQAIGVLSHLHSRGIAVPEDVSVVGFDDLPGSDFTSPPLTTVRVDCIELGKVAVERALDLEARSEQDPIVNRHRVELIVRESTTARV